MKLTNQQIREMVIKYLERAKALLDEPFGPNDGDRPFDDAASLTNYINGLDDVKADILEEMATGKYWRVKNDAFALLQEFGVGEAEIVEKSSAFSKLCEGLLRAQLKDLEYHKKRLTGIYHDDLEANLNAVFVGGDSTAVPPNTASQPGREKQEISISLKELIEQYWQENETAKAWSERTKTEYERGLNQLVLSFFGDVPVNTIDYEVGRAFKKHLMALPKRFNVLPRYNDVPFLELPGAREQQNDEPISSKTVNKYLGIAQGLFTYAVQHKHLKNNPISGLMIKETRRADEIRDPFSREDLEKLFLSEEYRSKGHKKPYQFWLPVLALYTGCRVEELCQLYAKDVTQIDGIWVLDINDEAPDKSVKTHERRLVPLHPFLTGELGFHVYAASKGDGRVFPELKRVKNRYSHYVSSNWFPAYKKRCGIQAESGNKTFHSFRHTVADYLKQNYDLPDHFISELLGHRNPNITTGRYGKRFDPKTLLERAVIKLDYYGIDLSHLKSSKWVSKRD